MWFSGNLDQRCERCRKAEQPELIHRVCQLVAERENLPHDCQKCPAIIQTDYGPGTQGCRLIAQEIIDMVRGDAETSAHREDVNHER